MDSQNLQKIFEEYLEYEKILNEMTTTSNVRGTYKPPLRTGIRKWFPKDHGPFTVPVTNFIDGETNYDSLDGELSKSKKEIQKREKFAKHIRDTDYKIDAPDEGDDEYAQAPYVKYANQVEDITEATASSNIGNYRAPLSPGLRIWKNKTLKPFVDDLSDYDNAELNYDSLDGDIETKNAKEKENKSRKISIYNEKHPVLNDEDGDILNQYGSKNKIDNNVSKPFVNEDLAVWFGTKKKPKGSKQPKGPWVNICRRDKDGKHPPCGRPEAHSKGYPKCRAAGVAGKMSDAQKKSACAQKRRAEKTNPKIGTGNKPKMVSYKPKKKTNESVIIDLIRKALD